LAGWLALVGGNEWREGCDFDAQLLSSSGTSEVLVFPTAAAFENPSAAVATATQWSAKLGASVVSCPVLNRVDAEKPENVALVNAHQFIYFSGGSPMHLRSVMQGSSVWQAVVDRWQAGAVLAGSSAGAMVLGDPMVDERGGAFTLGLGLVPGLSVLPHANKWAAERMRRTMKMASAVTLAMIDEQTALLHSPNGEWSASGVGEVKVYAKGETTTDLSGLPRL
jgi:cyanophycinase